MTSSLNDFIIDSKLGEGAYSSVYLVKRLADGIEYALKKVKIMNLSEKEKENALNEIRILASIEHGNIVQYKEAFLDDNSNQLCIIMDYNDNGDLYQKIVEQQKKNQLIKEEEIWNIFIQVTQGLNLLHNMKIFHRDLKSANVFLNKNGIVKLGDMNVSKVAKKGLLFTQTGTPYYASPEVWKEKPYDNKSDIWSLGCVLYEMTTLKPPFRAEDMEGLYKKVCRGLYPKIPSSYSQDLNNVIRCLLQVNPALRPSAGKILQLQAVQQRLNANQQQLFFNNNDSFNKELLNTIRIPRKMHTLQGLMPKPNYKSQSLNTPKTTQQFQNNLNLQSLSKNNNNLNSNVNSNNNINYKDIDSVQNTNSPLSTVLKERNITNDIINKNDEILHQILDKNHKPQTKLHSINDKNLYHPDQINNAIEVNLKQQRIKQLFIKQKPTKSKDSKHLNIANDILQEIQQIQPIIVRKQKSNNNNLPPLNIIKSNIKTNDLNTLSKNSLIINNKQYNNKVAIQ